MTPEERGTWNEEPFEPRTPSPNPDSLYSPLTMAWWIWVLLGFALLALELLTTGIHLGFFAIGAFVVSLLVALGVGGPVWLQFLLFSVISIALLVVLRQPIVRRLRESGTKKDVDAVVGQTALAIGDISAGQFGRAELRGSSWAARNIGNSSITNGQRCVVEKVDGLTLFVRGES